MCHGKGSGRIGLAEFLSEGTLVSGRLVGSQWNNRRLWWLEMSGDVDASAGAEFVLIPLDALAFWNSGKQRPTMRLRRECEHGRWEEHTSNSNRYHEHCPGGEFLPEGALVIEKVDGEWPEWALSVKFTELFLPPNKKPGLRFRSMSELLDALAAVQIGESDK